MFPRFRQHQAPRNLTLRILFRKNHRKDKAEYQTRRRVRERLKPYAKPSNSSAPLSTEVAHSQSLRQKPKIPTCWDGQDAGKRERSIVLAEPHSTCPVRSYKHLGEQGLIWTPLGLSNASMVFRLLSGCLSTCINFCVVTCPPLKAVPPMNFLFISV